MGGSNHFVMLRDSVGEELGNSKMACCRSQCLGSLWAVSSLGSLWAVTSQLGAGIVVWQGYHGVLGASAGLLQVPAVLTPRLLHLAAGSKSKHLKRER